MLIKQHANSLLIQTELILVLCFANGHIHTGNVKGGKDPKELTTMTKPRYKI